jgi:membrane protease YdiL (CAAX protease family)
VRCSSCGNLNADTSRFCTRCGAPLAVAATPAAADLPPTIVVAPLVDQRQQVASYWHTLLLVLLMLALSYSGHARSQRALSAGSRPLLYLSGIFLQWTLVGLVWLGIKRRGYSLRQLTGRAWRGFDDVLLDIALGALTWGGFFVIAAILALAMGLQKKLPELRKAIEFLVPASLPELLLFLVLGATAGICEEIIFRGYLQRQFAALSKSVVGGILLSAALFGASHLYEGRERMLIIAFLGVTLGAVAAWRKNLRPGMIAHTGQDRLAGTLQYAMRHLRT